MEEYLFVLGRDHVLSVAELFSYFKRKHIKHELKYKDSAVALFLLEKLPNINELGGTVKIAKKVDLKSIVPEKNKVLFSFTSVDKKDILLEEVKDFFKSEKVKAMQKYAQTINIPPSKSGMLDYEFLQFRKRLFQVVSVSNPKGYKERDENRPAFDAMKVISIRLAKILINLAEAEEEIVDPFCGTGTILQEAVLLGYKGIGIDRNIVEAKRNISWLGEHAAQKVRLIEGDARNISALIKRGEAVVTEPYLGPYLRKLPSQGEAKKIIAELEVLYKHVLKELAKVISGRVVIILPRIRTFTQKYGIQEDIIGNAGYRPVKLPEGIPNPIFYRKKRSRVERFIYVLEKLK